MYKLLIASILTYFAILQSISVIADDHKQKELMSSEQLTRDLMVVRTRGISLQPLAEKTADDSAAIGQGRVDLYIEFEYAKSSLTERSKLQLQALARAITDERLEDDSFLIAGHTDAVGSKTYNMILSKKRAESVVNYLSTVLQISRSRLVAKGFGEQKLKNSHDPENKENRRVEVINMRGM